MYSLIPSLSPCGFCQQVPRDNPIYLRVQERLVCRQCYVKYLKASEASKVEKKVYSSNCSTMPKEKREAYILCRRGNKGVRYIRKDQSLSQPNMTLSNTYPTQRSLKKCGQDFRLVNSEPKMMCALGEPPNKPLQIIPLRNPETDQTIVPMQRQALKHLPSEINTIGRNICMQPTSSRRPIHCPIYGCKCTIAVSTIMAHFSGVHPQVSLVPIEPDSTVQIAFSISSIPPRDSTCVALLLLRGKKTLEQHLWPMPLLAHRKRCKKTPNIVNIRPEIGLRPSSTGGLRSSIDSQKTRGNLSPSSDSVSSIIASFNDPRYSKPVVTKSSNIDTNLVFCLLGLESIQMYYRLTALHTATKYSTFRGPVFLLNESKLERRQTECMVYRESIEHDSTRTGFITMEVRMDRGTQDPCCNEDTSRLPGR